MDNLFTIDNLRSRSVLDTLCFYLKWQDLLSFEHVSLLTCSVVGSHQHYGKVTLRSPATTHLGPIINNTLLIVGLDGERQQEWTWLLATLVELAPHLKRLELQLYGYLLTVQDCQEMKRQSSAVLHGLTFPECTHLELIINRTRVSWADYRFPIDDFLQCFPSLVSLVMDNAQNVHFPLSSGGICLPRISSLQAPEKLQRLSLSFGTPDQGLPSNSNPTYVNFHHLEALALCHYQEKDYETDDEHGLVMTRLTGVAWLASFERQPPARLEHIRFSSLSYWSIALLGRCSETCRSLEVYSLADQDLDLIKKLRLAAGGGQLPKLSHLKLTSLESERATCDFLALAPALEVFQLGVYLDDYHKDENCDLQHPLHSLTRLVIDDYGTPLRRGWIESIRRNASAQFHIEIVDHT